MLAVPDMQSSQLFSLCHHRFALQLLTPASILSKLQGRTEIVLEDVQETDSLFLDARASARQLASGASALSNGNGNAAGGGEGAQQQLTIGRGEYMR